jgi:hypothetical protein
LDAGEMMEAGRGEKIELKLVPPKPCRKQSLGDYTASVDCLGGSHQLLISLSLSSFFVILLTRKKAAATQEHRRQIFIRENQKRCFFRVFFINFE